MLIKCLKNILLIIGLSSLGNVVFADSGPDAEMKEFVTAFNSQDAAGVAALFHDDGKLLPAGQPVISGVKAIEEFWAGAFGAGLSGIEKTPIEIVVSGDLAVETSSYFITFNDEK